MPSFMSPDRVEIGPAEITDIAQGDEGPQEMAIRERMYARRKLVRAAEDHQHGRMSDGEFDDVICSTHYKVNR